MTLQNAGPTVRIARERRRLAVVFSDLVDSTTIGQYLEAEEFSELLGDLAAIWHQCALAHGGYVARIQGDGALVVFGYPSSNEDDCRRAVEFALDTRERVERMAVAHALPRGVSLQLHAGIHAGTLLIGEGDIERGRFDLIGDVANTAAKLSRYATAGEILVSLEALGPYANFFELGEDRGPNPVSNLRVRSILGRADTERRFDATARRGLTPFTGRDEAIDRLMDFVSGDEADAPLFSSNGSAAAGIAVSRPIHTDTGRIAGTVVLIYDPAGVATGAAALWNRIRFYTLLAMGFAVLATLMAGALLANSLQKAVRRASNPATWPGPARRALTDADAVHAAVSHRLDVLGGAHERNEPA